ncbi:helix-turn-helix domain-containing protein [Mycobacterium intracellulare]|uniref:helix-turn-helix domain-containing protein n=1 Tax=Mycobacterium intracellulare TaxID=1767 RepID=UPI001EEDA8C4|nr:helix-turn-helix transcriptional regulator [Mycobacterium intracellulare]MEE3755252.1 helix-turn-helix transcriptional regulator [Mycobacterium intracellulare]
MTDGPEAISEVDGSDHLAAKLNTLFDMMHPRGGAPLSNYAAARGIEQKTGVSITPQYLGQLRAGKKRNPTMKHVKAIAEFFGVSARYLLEPGRNAEIESQLEMLRAMREAGVSGIAARAAGLSPETRRDIAAILDRARSLERLPPVDIPAVDE